MEKKKVVNLQPQPGMNMVKIHDSLATVKVRPFRRAHKILFFFEDEKTER